MPIIDPGVEEPARDMLGHAIRGELQDLAALVQSAGGERYRQVLGLCLTAAAYVAVDVSGRWPTDADVREIARLVSERGTEVRVSQEDVYDYLSGAALGFRPLPEALGGDAAAAALPILITGSLLFTFRPEGQKWWDYLDQIWSAYETAETMDATVLPALQVRTRMLREVAARDPGTRPRPAAGGGVPDPDDPETTWPRRVPGRPPDKAFNAAGLAGLLQNPAYAQALAEADPGFADGDARERAVEAVLARQQAVLGERRPDVRLVIGSAGRR